MFSLQTIFGKGDKFYGLLEQSAEAARDSARALHDLVSRKEHAPVMAAFAASRARELMSSLRKMCARWASTVRGDTKSCSAICRLVRPWATRLATVRSGRCDDHVLHVGV